VEGFGFPLFVFIAWIVFSVIRSAAKAAGELQKQQRTGGGVPKTLPGMNPDFLEMLRQLERAGRSAEEPIPAPAPTAPRRLPTAPPRRQVEPPARDEAEFVEDARSLEVDVHRAAREEISLDTASEAAIRRRREAAARRDLPRSGADHAAFDARIRAEADKTAAAPAAAPLATARLQHALIWNEILGRPVSLRDEPDPRSR
jgi:hypothetical protein